MGAPLAYSPGGDLIYHTNLHALATKKDRVEAPPEAPPPTTGSLWVWRRHSFSIMGHNTEMFTYPFDQKVTVGDILVNDGDTIWGTTYFYHDIYFDTWEERNAYIATYDNPNVSLRIAGHVSRLPNSEDGEGTIQFQVTVSQASSYPFPYYTWDFFASTHAGIEFIIIPISASAQNGQHPLAVTGWAAYERYRYPPFSW